MSAQLRQSATRHEEGARTGMHKVLVILRKEFLEIAQQRILLYSILLPPLLFIVIPLIFLQRVGNGSRASSLKVPSLQGLTVHEYTQGLVGTEFSNIFFLLSMIVPSVIAAYSIIGEKSNHTLEPLLATPVRRWQLLAGKILSALLPAVLVTWISGGIFIAELAILTDARAFRNREHGVG
jgi:ABC-2 type transport system permease protein